MLVHVKDDGIVLMTPDTKDYKIYSIDTALDATKPFSEQVDLQLIENKILLEESDKDMARITEDLIAILVGKGVIALTDFSAAVIEKREIRQDLGTIVRDATPVM
jgi:hypothetical protein